MSELSELLVSISSFGENDVLNENIVSEDFDKLILLMSQASTSLSTVVHFLKILVVNPQSQSYDHLVETPKYVSKRRRKKHRGSEGSSFEESLQLQPLDETNVENNLDHLSAVAAARSPNDECPPTTGISQTPCPETESQINRDLNPRTPVFCSPDSDSDRDKQKSHYSSKLSTFEDKLFREPISPIVSLQPSEGDQASVVSTSHSLTPAPANSTFNASGVSGDDVSERDSVSKTKNQEKRSTVRISFGEADYFYFQRCQGWSSVCRDGGNTLGMSTQHFHWQTRALQDSDGFLQELNTFETDVKSKGSESLTELNDQVTTELEYLSLSSSCDKRSQNNSLQLQESDYSLDTSKFGKKGELGTRGLERITPRKRRALLRSCSVPLDPREAEELREIRVKRESVGCDCYGGKCEAHNCSCASEGILCHQVRPRVMLFQLTLIITCISLRRMMKVPAPVLKNFATILREDTNLMRPKFKCISLKPL